jgi:hypothetical protein
MPFFFISYTTETHPFLASLYLEYQNRERLMRPLKIMKMERISKMKSREIEYIDKISFELSQIRKNLSELSAIIDVVDEKCNAGGSVINDYFDMQKSLNSLIEKINKSTEEERNILEKLKKKEPKIE